MHATASPGQSSSQPHTTGSHAAARKQKELALRWASGRAEATATRLAESIGAHTPRLRHMSTEKLLGEAGSGDSTGAPHRKAEESMLLT